jgi:hypothetical protein
MFAARPRAASGSLYAACRGNDRADNELPRISKTFEPAHGPYAGWLVTAAAEPPSRSRALQWRNATGVRPADPLSLPPSSLPPSHQVAVPVGLAGALFAWMMTRTIVSDPDGHANARNGLNSLEETTKVAEQRGDGWRGSIRDHFTARIKSGSTSIFPNKV